MTTNKDALDYLNEVLAWAEVGIQQVQAGKTVPDLNYVGQELRTALTQPNQELVEATYHGTDYSSPLRPKRLEYTMCGKIYAVQENGERHMFMDVRGWGYLTGGGAKKLPYEEATSIQDKWANEVCNLWNAAPETTAPVLEVMGLEASIHIVTDLLQNYGGDKDKGEFDAIRSVIEAACMQLARQKGGVG